MALPAAQPRYLACSQLNDGKAEAVNVKAWVYTKADGEPLVLLELRRLLHSCGKIARKNMRMTSWQRDAILKVSGKTVLVCSA